LPKLLPALLGLVVVATLGAATSLAATPTTIKDAHDIACPAPPSGWTLPPPGAGGQTVLTPLTMLAGETDGLQGGNSSRVICGYATQSGKYVIMEVLFALPTDPNPLHDFYYGCGSGGKQWTDSERIFLQTSPSMWAIVAFADPRKQLQGADVGAFQGMARQLLKNANGFAHVCETPTAETPTLMRFVFNFEVSAGSVAGSFYTQGLNAKLESFVTSDVPAMTLNLKKNGKRHPITLEMKYGEYVPARPGKLRQVRLGVVVTSSKVPGCPVGSAGTLTMTTAPSVRLAVCSQSFLQGPSSVNITSR
jgi:hypothetical protein